MLELRSDTKRLLDRLGQPDFNYRENDDTPATSTDRWPLFEVVSRQLHQGHGRSAESIQSPTDAVEPLDEGGNDIQSLIARISRGRAA